MTTYLGVDWASNGWAVAVLDDDLRVTFSPTIWNLWHAFDDPEQICIDVPVGLPEDRRRECDRQAKEFLGGRRSSVFWTPVRPAVYADTIADAKAHQTDATDHSISNQTWAIVPRIREVDGFLHETEAARPIVRESHPEVCFCALDGDPLTSKSGDDGLDARKSVLARATAEFERVPTLTRDDCERAIRRLAEPAYAPRAGADDVLDAIVLAVTAKSVARGSARTLPPDPPEDARGLPMEIVAPDVRD